MKKVEKEEEEDKKKKKKTKYEIKPLYHHIRFIDSFKFMATSLEKLVNNLSKDAFDNVRRYYTENELDLLTRKGVYPYVYIDSPKRMEENQLPPKEAFYFDLNDEHITDEDYEHAHKVWKTLGMKTMRDYHDLYNQVDIFENFRNIWKTLGMKTMRDYHDLYNQVDIFENFRNICCKNYNLDLAHYFTAPGLALDAALKVTEVELKLLSDMDMLLMVEKGIRGGVSVISNRYGKSNNKYMGDKFEVSKPSKYITYLDANNLYGWAMSKPLP